MNDQIMKVLNKLPSDMKVHHDARLGRIVITQHRTDGGEWDRTSDLVPDDPAWQLIFSLATQLERINAESRINQRVVRQYVEHLDWVIDKAKEDAHALKREIEAFHAAIDGPKGTAGSGP